MKNASRFLTLILLCLTLGSYAANGGDEDALLGLVNNHLQRGEPKKALKMLNSRISEEPNNLELLNKRAEVYVLMKREKDAVKELKNIISLDSKYSPVYLTTAQLKLRLNQTDSALHYINKGLDFNPDANTVESLYGLKGNILMTMEKFREAEDCLVAAANTPDVSMDTMRDLAAVLAENGKDDEAMIVLKETIELFGEEMESLINAGYICNKMGLYDEAIDYLERALVIDLHNPYALSNLANSYVQIGGLDIAFRHIERSINNDSTNPYAYKVKGDCLVQMGENQRACREYKKAVQVGYSVLYSSNEIQQLIIATCGAD